MAMTMSIHYVKSIKVEKTTDCSNFSYRDIIITDEKGDTYIVSVLGKTVEDIKLTLS